MKNVNNIVMYAENERKEAFLNYAMDVKVNGDHCRDFKEGEQITLLGEYTQKAESDALNAGATLKQYIFTNGENVYTIYEGQVTITPEEKLEVGDFVRIYWDAIGTKTYKVKKGANAKYNLHGLLQEGTTAFCDNDSLNGLLKELHNISSDYEILPKSEYMLDIVRYF